MSIGRAGTEVRLRGWVANEPLLRWLAKQAPGGGGEEEGGAWERAKAGQDFKRRWLSLVDATSDHRIPGQRDPTRDNRRKGQLQRQSAGWRAHGRGATLGSAPLPRHHVRAVLQAGHSSVKEEAYRVRAPQPQGKAQREGNNWRRGLRTEVPRGAGKRGAARRGSARAADGWGRAAASGRERPQRPERPERPRRPERLRGRPPRRLPARSSADPALSPGRSGAAGGLESTLRG